MTLVLGLARRTLIQKVAPQVQEVKYASKECNVSYFLLQFYGNSTRCREYKMQH